MPVKKNTSTRSKKKTASKKTVSKKDATKKSSTKQAAKKTRSTAKKTVAKKPSTAKKSAKTAAKVAAPKKSTSKKTKSVKKAVATKKTTSAKKIAAPRKSKEVKKVSAPTKAKSDKKETAPKKNTASKKVKSSLKTSKAASKVKKVDSSKKAASKADPNFKDGTAYRVSSPSKTELRTFRKANNQKKDAEKTTISANFSGKSFLKRPGKKGKNYKVDLRIQAPGTLGYFSVGGVEPGPALCRLAKVKGLEIIGLTDFYSSEQIKSLEKFEGWDGLTIIPGVDLRCKYGRCDEVFLTVLFEDVASIDVLLSNLNVPAEAAGSKDHILSQELKTVIKQSEALGGVVIPSRIDKTPQRSLVIPDLVNEFGFHVFDLVYTENPMVFEENWPKGEFTFLCFSNAQALAQIGSRSSSLKLAKPGFAGIAELAERRI